jgi:hypothetical protein
VIDFSDHESYSSSVANLPRSIVLLYAAHFFLAEVHNGGFLQFFWNSTGLIAPEAVEGFMAIGMPQLAALLKTTAAPLGSPYPRDRNSRWDALLMASGRSQRELKQIFKRTPNMYLAFAEATKPLLFDEQNRLVWELAESENGGFQEAATRYSQSLDSIQ